MRMFNGLLFQGAGWFSGLMTLALERRFHEACALAGGLQQPGSVTDPPDDPDEISGLENDLEEMVREIAMALTGRDISFGREMPYPPDNLHGMDMKELFNAIKAEKANRRRYEYDLMRELDRTLNPEDSELKHKKELLRELKRKKAQRHIEDERITQLEIEIGVHEWPEL